MHLGLYRQEGEHNHCPYNKQVTTEKTSNDQFIYKHSDGTWIIGAGLGAGVNGLKNQSKVYKVPLTGWNYHLRRFLKKNQYNKDKDFKISSELPLPCREITIEATQEMLPQNNLMLWELMSLL